MIAPMKKYSFWVFHKEYEPFLEELRQLGIVHIEEKGSLEDEKLSSQLKELQRYTTALKGLERYSTEAETTLEAAKAVDNYESYIRLIEGAKTKAQKTEKEIKQVEVWGEFDHRRITTLKDEGIFLHFFTCAEYAAEDYPIATFKINEQSSKVYFVAISKEAEAPNLNAESITLPTRSATELKTELVEIEKTIEETYQQLNTLSASKNTIAEAIKTMSDEVQLTKVKLYTENIADNKAMLIEGYAPKEKENALNTLLERKSIFYTSEEPKEEDNVPILLKNNRFNRLFEVISDLYSKPKYNEFDLTPFFGIFYMIFFGFCLGDTGYGLLYLAIATIIKRKVDGSMKSVVSLVQLLSLSTVFFGIAGGTFFGIELYKTGLPGYRHITESLSGIEGTFVKDPIQDMMLKASIGLGLVQMLLGMFINGFKIKKQKGFKHSISAFCWPLFFIFSGVNAVMITGTNTPFLNPIYAVLGGLSVFGIFFMNSPGKNPLVNFGTGLWDAYNNLVGGVGDLLSYMRLFALALASSILGLVFNTLGLKILDTDGNIFTIILTVIGMLVIMTIGHAMNIFMSTLSSAVHPLRLTFVEFYKNAGFEGGGKAFEPFKKTV